MLKNRKYWRDRAKRLSNREFKKADRLAAKLQRAYERSEKAIIKEIEEIYSNYAKDNKLSIREAKRLLTPKELSKFQWDIDEYKRICRKNNISKEWQSQLDKFSKRIRLNRLDALKIQIQQELEVLMNNQYNDVKDLLSDMYEDKYYRSIFDIQKGLGHATTFDRLDKRSIEAAIMAEYDEKDFSSWTWGNKKQLIGELHHNLEQSFILGEDLKTVTKRFAARMNTGINRARRLINTESALISSTATHNSYEEHNIAQYQILATLDTRTTDICQSMDGKVFNVKDIEVGLNYPPFHYNCRTTTVAYLDDTIDIRIARDKAGKNIYVPSNMTYDEWYKEYIA